MDHREVLSGGTILDGKYRIERVLGAGGFGITYIATDIDLDTSVAVKEFFPSGMAMRDRKLSVQANSKEHRQTFDHLRSSFIKEAQILARLNDPSIVRVLSVFQANGTGYLVMRMEVGPTVKVWLKQLGRPPTQTELDGFLVSLLRALEQIHAQNIVHRDIAPDSIILRSDGSPVLIDFGSARHIAGDNSDPITGIVKPGYSSPEQYSSDTKGQGPWTDIYALGVTLYQAVTGKMPQESPERMLSDELVPAINAAHAGFRQSFLKAIDWSLAVHPKSRPQNIAEWRVLLLEPMFNQSALDELVRDDLQVTQIGASKQGASAPSRPPRPTGTRIFISYRRADSAHVAGRVFDHLESAFGPENLFFDVDNIPFGVDFRGHISAMIRQSAVLVAIIGPEWGRWELQPQAKQRWFGGKGSTASTTVDFVEMEIEAALLAGIPIIPVLVESAAMPSPESLPKSIRDICYRNAATIRAGRDFRGDMARVIAAATEYRRQAET